MAEGYRVDPWSTKAIERLTDAPLWSQSQMERRPITRRVDHDHLGPALYPWSPAPMAGLMLCATLDLVGFNDGYVTLHLSPTVEGSPLLQPDCLEAALQIITGALIATRRERKIAARCRLAHKKIMAQAQRISAVATPWGLEGQDEAITDLRSQAATFADADVPILITGPAGAGRWALATHLHQISGFCQRPLTRLHCAALHGHIKACAALIVDAGADKERGDKLGHPPTRYGDEMFWMQVDEEVERRKAADPKAKGKKK